VIAGLRARFGRRLPLEFRMDAAFFQPDVLRLLPARGCGYAIKVGYWHWLHYEYAAVATNRVLDLPALYAFINGRGAQEKTLAELKGEFALDVVPTAHYGANSAWQQLSVLAHNLARSFQLDTLATPKPRSRKRTYAYLIRSMRTLRFLLIVRAGRLARGGRHVLRLSHNPATEGLYASIGHRLAA
jgi:hypothetical protein